MCYPSYPDLLTSSLKRLRSHEHKHYFVTEFLFSCSYFAIPYIGNLFSIRRTWSCGLSNLNQLFEHDLESFVFVCFRMRKPDTKEEKCQQIAVWWKHRLVVRLSSASHIHPLNWKFFGDKHARMFSLINFHFSRFVCDHLEDSLRLSTIRKDFVDIRNRKYSTELEILLRLKISYKLNWRFLHVHNNQKLKCLNNDWNQPKINISNDFMRLSKYDNFLSNFESRFLIIVLCSIIIIFITVTLEFSPRRHNDFITLVWHQYLGTGTRLKF